MRRLAVFPTIILLIFVITEAGADERDLYGFPAARLLDKESDFISDGVCSVREYTPEELKALGFRDVAGFLSMAVGGYVDVGDVFPQRQESYLRMRGRAPSALQVLLDGVPIRNGWTNFTDLTHIPLHQVALIRVTTGPCSTRYGNGIDAGTIEILTYQVGDDFSADFTTDIGTGDAHLYSLWFGDTQDYFNYFGSAGHDDRRVFMLSNNFNTSPGEAGGERDHSEAARDTFRGRMGFDFGLPFQVYAGGSYDQDKKDIPDELGRPIKGTQGLDAYSQRRRATGQMNLVSKPSKYFELIGAGYVTEDTSELDTFANLESLLPYTQKFNKDLMIGGRFLPTVNFGKYSRIRMGAEFSQDKISFWNQGVAHDQFDSQIQHYSLEDDLRPFSWLGLTLGVAYERQECSSDDLPSPDPFTSVSPRAGLLISPVKGVALSAGAARKSRSPTMDELFNTGYGNVDLDPETIDLVEVSYDHAIDEYVRWRLTGFSKNIKDVILGEYQPATRSFGESLNAGEMKTFGFTALLETHPLEGLFARADYTYLTSKFSPDDENGDWPEGEYFAPEHRADLIAGYRFDFGLGASFGLMYVGDQNDPEATGQESLPDFSLAHARVFYNYREFIELFCAAENMTDANYETARRYPMPGLLLHGGASLIF